MCSKVFAIIFLCFTQGLLAGNVFAARTVSFCGMKLKLNEAAEQLLNQEVQRLTASPRYFNQMVKRAQMYMPFIEPALTKADVPSDLKYLAIQESSLRPDAVSSSQAVGIWQLKEATGLSLGLRIDEEIDERRHISRASEGAAAYLTQVNEVFDNWVYALIAYHEGPTGALAYTDNQFYGVSQMTIDAQLHWYVLRAIAHKLAYEKHLGQPAAPDLQLKSYVITSEFRLERIAAEHNITPDLLLTYNPWLLANKRIPKDYEGVYFVPVRKTPVVAPPNNSAPVTINRPPSSVRSPYSSGKQGLGVALPANQLGENEYAEFPIKRDLHYGTQYVFFDGSKPLPALSLIYGYQYSDLLSWNNLLPGQQPEYGSILYLLRPTKAAFHIVEPGETLFLIAEQHHLSTRKIQRKNRMDQADMGIYVGQKLYLKSKKPIEERMIILSPNVIESASDGVAATPDPSSTHTEYQPTPIRMIELDKPQWIDHEVKRGETLWAIAQQYGSEVEIIKQANDLVGNNIKEGQTLRVLAKKRWEK